MTEVISEKQINVNGDMVLIPLQPSDAEAYYDLLRNNEEHFAGEGMAEKYPDLESVTRSLKTPSNPDRQRFGILRISDGAFVGTINLEPDENDPTRFEIGYLIGKEFGRRRYASECALALSDHAFENLGASEIYALTDPENTASQKVLLK